MRVVEIRTGVDRLIRGGLVEFLENASAANEFRLYAEVDNKCLKGSDAGDGFR